MVWDGTITKHPLLVRLENALAALGTDPDDIASRLCQEGHFGDSHNTSCPLARYLQQALGTDWLASVNGETVTVPGYGITAVLPRPVKRFVLKHDQGGYPFLRPYYKPLEPNDVL